MGLMDMVNKVIGKVQSVTSTTQNAKYTYDQAKSTAESLKPTVAGEQGASQTQETVTGEQKSQN